MLFFYVIAAFLACGQTAQTPPKDLTSTSLEDLMNVEVTSASKKEQKLSQVAAAAFVITQDDRQQEPEGGTVCGEGGGGV